MSYHHYYHRYHNLLHQLSQIRPAACSDSEVILKQFLLQAFGSVYSEGNRLITRQICYILVNKIC